MLRVFLSACAMAALLCSARPVEAWQDLSENFVRDQVACLLDAGKSRAEKDACRWRLVSVGRPAVYPLGEVARKHPELAWEAVGLLDSIRVNSQLVRLFSEFLDAPPEGLKSTGEVQGFLRSRLEQMLGRSFKNDEQRRRWVKNNSKNLVYDPARFRFELKPEAYRGGWLPTKVNGGPEKAVSLAYERLLKALHCRQEKALRSLVGPGVALVHGGGKKDTRPELDLDAFGDPLFNHRALLIRKDGQGRWLVRAGDAYFHFAGKDLKCVKAGMKPME